MKVYYIIANNGQKYYYQDGKRITSEEGKSLGASKKPDVASRKKSKKTSRARIKVLKPCKSHQYRDPDTGRCRNKSGVKRDRRRKSKKSSRVPCKSHQYRDPDTGRCRNKSGVKRDRRRKSKKVSRIVKSKRWSRVKKIVNNCVERSKLPLRDLQIKVIEYMEEHDGLIVVHGTGCGKCHGIDTPILMYDGTIKKVQDVKVGDQLMGIDSTPRNVLSLARGRENMYKIIQKKGGKDYVVNKSHILTLKLTHPKGIYKTTNKGTNYIVANWFSIENYKRQTKWYKFTSNEEELQVRNEAQKFLDTLQIDDTIDIPLTEYMKLSKKDQHILKGFRVGVEFTEKDTPLDPYFLGLWLGDGCSRNPSVTNVDQEIIDYIYNKFSDNYDIRIDNDEITYHIVSKKIEGQNRHNDIRTVLQNLNLLQNKHIPAEYLYNCRKVRLSLLAGLIDSDGWHRTGGCYEIIQKQKQLADDIEYLVRSLGMNVTSSIVSKSCEYKGETKTGQYYRITFSTSDNDIPVLLERKKPDAKSNKDLLTNSIDIESIGEDDYYGFVIDGDHRYLLGDFTATHNTLTAVTASQCYLDKYPKRKVVFIGPASLITNFKKEMKSYGVKNVNKYSFYSYDKFMLKNKGDHPIRLKNKFLIVDEAHNLRNPLSKKSIAVVKASLHADKRLLLTATPFVNAMTDFIPLINMAYGKMIVGTRKQFYNNETDEWLGKEVNEENLSTFKYLLQDKVDMVDCQDPKYFPERIDYYVDVPMEEDYYERYVKLVNGEDIFDVIFDNPDAFYNGYRRAVNRAGKEYYSSKIKASIPIFRSGKSIIFTNWLEFGIIPIKEILKENNISFRTFYGDIPLSERQDIVDDFNNNKFQVLILSRAGGEGIDLKEVRNVVVLDPTWNDAGLQQVIGRAIRYNSHVNLPVSQRKVNVYFMLLVKPKIISSESAVPSGDKLLYAIIEKKNEISVTILALLKELSI